MWPCTIRHIQLRAKETSLDREARHFEVGGKMLAGCEYIRCSVIEPSQGNTRSSQDAHISTHARAHPSRLHLEHLASRPGSGTWRLELLRLSGMLWPVILKLGGQQTVCTCGHTEGHDHYHTA